MKSSVRKNSPHEDMSETLSSTQAVIDLAGFHNNIEVVRACISQRTAIMAVVKARAYGHGLLEIADAATRAGVEYLGVARLEEGIELRDAGITSRILIFEIVPPQLHQRAIVNNLDLTIASEEGAQQIANASARLSLTSSVHLKIDTGMGRLGVASESATHLTERIAAMKRLELRGIYSHFATAEDIDQSYAREQLDRFLRVLDGVRAKGIEVPLRHMANSGAILSLPESHLDMVRPGVMLYGYTPVERMPTPKALSPVMSLVSKVGFVKRVAKGTSISYGRTYRTAAESTIATIPVGYGDGYSRLLTGKAEVLIRGKRYPVVGTICMDQIMVDVGNDSVFVGDRVTLLGQDGHERVTAWDLANRMGTIPYEVTCLITPRVHRLFTENTTEKKRDQAL